jgi:hypothetical protein
MNRFSISFVAILLGSSQTVSAQSEKPQMSAIIMKTGVGYNYGVSDLGKRFPAFSIFPAEVYYKSAKDFTFGVSYQRFLGNQVRIDSLYGGILGATQMIFDNEGFPAQIRYYMRGFMLQGHAGKLFSMKPEWEHGRIELKLGFGIMQHKIRTKFDQGKLPQLEGEYATGYDRLSNGALFSQSIIFHYLNVETVSIFAGINFGQALTKNRRSWDYSLMRQDITTRKDFFIGASAGILIPIVLNSSTTTKYYD